MLYLEHPERNSAQPRALNGALLIQRLEGSRRHVRLCTLNGSDRVQKSGEEAVMGMIWRFESGMEWHRIGMRRPAEAEEVAERASADR